MNMGLDNLFPVGNPVFLFLFLLWSIFWKGLALWKSARNDQRYWFLVILVVSTLGILEIVYLFRFSKKRLTLSEMKGWLKR